MGFCHVVFIRLDDEVPAARARALADGLRRLPAVIDGIKAYEVGEDLGITTGAPDITVVAHFADRNAFDAYRAHPEHLTLVEELLEPVATRISSQFMVDDDDEVAT
jgi:hypothetical protein